VTPIGVTSQIENFGGNNMTDTDHVTCSLILGALFVRRGETSVRLTETQAAALKKQLQVGLVISDGTNQIVLQNEADVHALAGVIAIIQRSKQQDRRRSRRALR
jgi:hypothetical protein